MEKETNREGSSILVAGSILAVAQILVRVIELIYRVPLMRVLGDEGMGYYALSNEVYQFFMLISTNGIPLALSMLTASHLAKQEYKNAQKIVKCTLVFAGVIGLILSLLTFFGSGWIAQAFFSTINVSPALKIIAPTLVLSSLVGVLRGYFQGRGAMLPTAISQVIEQIVNALVSVLAAYLLIVKGAGYGAAGGAAGAFAGAFCALAFCMLLYHQYKPVVKREVKSDQFTRNLRIDQVIGLVVITMTPVILSQIVFRLSSILDSAFYNKILSARGYMEQARVEMYGVYSGEYQLIINIPTAVITAVGIAFVPIITRSITLKLADNLNEKIESIIRVTMTVALPCCIGVMVLASPIIQLVFSDSSNLPVQLMAVGGLTIGLYALATVTMSILQALQDVKKPAVNSIIALLVHICLLIPLLYFTDMNVFALVFGNYIFLIVLCVLNIRSIEKHHEYKQEMIRTFLLPLITSLCMGVITWLSYKFIDWLFHNNLISIIFSLIISVVVYALGILILGVLSQEEILSVPKGRSIIKICKKMHIM